MLLLWRFEREGFKMKMINLSGCRIMNIPETCLSQITIPAVSIPEQSLTEIIQPLFQDFYDIPHPDSKEEFERLYLQV